MKAVIKYVKSYKDRHGKVRTYYRRAGLSQRIDGEPGSSEWLACYARIDESFNQPSSSTPDHETLNFAIQEYIASQRFQKLAATTRSNYRSCLDELAEKLGTSRLSDFTRGSVVQLRDRVAQRSMSRAALMVKILRLVFEGAADLDLIDRNPARGVRPPEGFKSVPHRKWTDEEIALFVERGKPHVRRAMMVLLYTGLRMSDALPLQRTIIKNGLIEIKTEKTDTDIVIPVHHHLKAELERPLPVETVYLISGARGQRLKRHGLLSMFKREFTRLGVVDQPTGHGLRKNAVVSLIEAGATEQTINAITGQSIPMIRHYGQEYERRKLALKVVPLWDEAKRKIERQS